MLEYFIEQNWDALKADLMVRIIVILLGWGCMITAAFVDLWSGVDCAKACGEKIINAIKSEGQATRDLLQQHWREEIQQKYDDARLELSQYRQNQYLINQLRPATAAAVTA